MKGISKASACEMKSLVTPPQGVVNVQAATAILLGLSVEEAKV